MIIKPGGPKPPIQTSNRLKTGSHNRNRFNANPWYGPNTKPYRVPMNDRPFIVWDGEGDESGNGSQNYILLGYLVDTDHYDYVQARSLTTDVCLQFIYETACEYDQYIHVAFGFGYDVDQILKDMPDHEQEILVTDNSVKWNGWLIHYLPHKMFKLKLLKKGAKQITIFDAMTFFGTSMVKAAAQYVPGHPLLDVVEQGKTRRGSFTFADIVSVRDYWRAENELFLSTMCALRQSLKGAGIYLDSWHGPGAVANTLIKSNRLGTYIQQSRDDMPLAAIEATQFAYFGGRFENSIVGRILGPIYGYDIRSAYPAALAKMPGLRDGTWRHRYAISPDSVSDWGLYRYSYKVPPGFDAFHLLGLGPIPNRAPNGTISYALCSEGWIYGHEIRAAHLSGWEIDIAEGWDFEQTKEYYPFIFTNEMYVKRAQYKRNNNPAQLGLKLGMNSVYGKLAQTVGIDVTTMQPPRYHHAWHAGQITSWCRARIQLAMAQQPRHIVACETDGIYSLAPLNLRIGPHLGEWELTVYDEMIYVQNGFYFARKGECPNGCAHRPEQDDSHCAWRVAKVRGLSTGKHADLPTIFDSVDTLSPITTYVPRYGSLTGYIGRPQAHQWFTQERTTEWGGGGKRYHEPLACPRCQGRWTTETSGVVEPFHRTIMSRGFMGQSSPRSLPWCDDPDMDDSIVTQL